MSAPGYETLTREEFAARLLAQGVPREHLAFQCWMCGTAQSLRSFELAGVPAETAERQIGFSCVGRHTRAGAWDPSSTLRRLTPGCDWTLGGFIPGGAIKLVGEGGRTQWSFAVATPEAAAALRARGGRILAPEPAPAQPQEAPQLPAATQGYPDAPTAQPSTSRRRRRSAEAT